MKKIKSTESSIKDSYLYGELMPIARVYVAKCKEEGHETITVSMIQRKMRIGYAAADKVLDVLVEEGVLEWFHWNGLARRRVK